MKKVMARKTFPYDPTLSGKHKKYEGYRLIASQKTDPELIELLDINPDAVPDLILSSPLKRAVQTANFFSKQKNTPMIIMDDLREVQFDLKNLVSEVEFNKHGSNLVRQRFINSFIEDDLIDSRQQLQNRLNKTLDFIKKCERDKILIVSHSFLLKILETYLNDSFLFERPKIIKSYFDTTQKTYEFGEGYNFCI